MPSVEPDTSPAGADEGCVLIPGFALAGYRSFGPELQRVGPCAKVNLFIGQNNSGKSNLLRFIQDHYTRFAGGSGSPQAYRDLEQHRVAGPLTPAFGRLVDVTEAHHKALSQIRARDYSGAITTLDQVLGSGVFERRGTSVWVDVELPPGATQVQAPARLVEKLLESSEQGFFRQLALAIGGNAYQTDEPGNVKQVLAWLRDQLRPAADIADYVTIPAVRAAGRAAAKDAKDSNYSGDQIIQSLARLQNPAHDAQHLKKDFNRVEHFLQEVTDRPDARLEVPFERDTIVVHMDGRSLPLEALGTGIHQVIILAAAATALHRHVVCIEEPEANLHPLLQKKLLRYLEENTDNQYFIATHSAHLLDHPGAAVFHVRLTEAGSKVTVATDPAQRFSICTDLGYRASDLLQSNCVIWVEGPSDRIYLREWIRLCDPDLAEGIDYSLMFYGGRLLSHLSPDDPEVEEFISLRRLNRNLVVVMDSDRRKAADPINATKQRIVDSWMEQPSFAWVTAGREVENYVEPAAVLAGLQAVAPRSEHRLAATPYQQAIPTRKGGASAADKVKLAHWLVAEGKLTLDRLDLRPRVEALCDFIRQANHVRTVAAPASGSPLGVRRSPS